MSNVVKIRKGNRILNVEESRLSSFLNQGYDQIDDNGTIVKRATGGRNVTVAELNEVIEAKELLEEQLANSDSAELLKENKALKTKVTKLERELEELKKPTDSNASGK
ncbi:hypothetical protein [Lysinibacillus sp. NPDC093216]|uniref:hypothetical protein n=1 Tax=Lysinibacillus sp. NPDC093216 TaxID=3390576 RepID=UPI003D031B67